MYSDDSFIGMLWSLLVLAVCSAVCVCAYVCACVCVCENDRICCGLCIL